MRKAVGEKAMAGKGEAVSRMTLILMFELGRDL